MTVTKTKMNFSIRMLALLPSLLLAIKTILTHSYSIHKIRSARPKHQNYNTFIKKQYHYRQNQQTSLYSQEKEGATQAIKDNKEQRKNNKLIPITLLAGFLGSGKTTTLKYLLENKENMKIGVIVNDVASVNIDAKLITSSSTTNDNEIMSEHNSIELENGCACCSLSDELLVSIERLIQLKQNNEQESSSSFDEIIIELSGVADPASVLLNFEQAQIQKHPVTLLSNITNIVTLIDSTTFGNDFMTQHLVRNRDNWMPSEEDCIGNRQISELLVEQVECANTILLNKIDLATEDQVATASNVASGLNEYAILKTIEYGRISVKDFFIKDDNDSATTICEDPACIDTSHSHSHQHSDDEDDNVSNTHSHAHEESCSDPTCSDPSHDHSHSHDHNKSCNDPECTDTSHDHSHDHNSCSDPDCTDSSHDHSHSHDHNAKNTATSNLGISNFVYKSTRPFHPIRIMSLLYTWPILHNQNDLDLTLFTNPQTEDNIPEDMKENPFFGVLRSKGFSWIAPSSFFNDRVILSDVWRHNTAMYWSHAGKYFGLNTAGQWWGSISKDQMKEYFTENSAEYERIITQDFVSDEFDDRRQELVFIGVNMNEDGIRKRLEECECTDDEMKMYREKLEDHEASLLAQEQDEVEVIL